MKFANLPIITLLAVIGCSSNNFIQEEELIKSWSQGSAYKVIDSQCKLTDRFPSLLDSIRRIVTPSKDYSVRLSDSDGTQYSLGIGTPFRSKSDKEYPLVIYLHGGVGTTVDNKGERAYEMLSGLRDSLDLFLASPSANRFAPWWTARGQKRILQTIRYMTLQYPIDKNKIFLSGVSDGATGCYAAANSINGPFAGFFAISGYGGMLPNLGIRISLENMKRRPIYNINAGNDRLYSLPIVERFLDYLVQSGIPLERKIYPEEQHGFDYREKEVPALVERIRSWSKPEEQSFNWELIDGLPNAPEEIVDFEKQNSNQPAKLKVVVSGTELHISAENLNSVQLIADSGLSMMAQDSQKASEFSFSKKILSNYHFFRLNLLQNSSVYSVQFRR